MSILRMRCTFLALFSGFLFYFLIWVSAIWPLQRWIYWNDLVYGNAWNINIKGRCSCFLREPLYSVSLRWRCMLQHDFFQGQISHQRQRGNPHKPYIFWKLNIWNLLWSDHCIGNPTWVCFWGKIIHFCYYCIQKNLSQKVEVALYKLIIHWKLELTGRKTVILFFVICFGSWMTAIES